MGWSKNVKNKNLHFIANNTKYLVLPWVTVKCLASKVLALNIKRISSDWLKVYNYPLYMLETFVEQDRFKGTCYKASRRMTSLDKFSITSVSKELNGINSKISITHDVPFPCIDLLSKYSFKKRFVKILPNGDVQGGFAKMIVSLIDFSFIRSLCALCYSIKSPPAYDPPTLFLLILFRYLDRHQNMDKFLEVLQVDFLFILC